MHDPCVMWYLSPFACLYDLLQFGFGHLNGFESSSDDAGRESVVDARAVALAPALPFALALDAPPLVEEDEDEADEDEDEDEAPSMPRRKKVSTPQYVYSFLTLLI